VEDTQRRRVAVVTGGSRGLGAAVARVLAGRGFDLVLSARTGSAELEGVAEALRGAGARVRVCVGDLVEERTREALVQAAATLGGVDLLVNNASELGGISPLTDVPVERLERLWRINVIAPVALVRVMLPLLTARRGTVVNLSSDAAIGAYAGWGAYGATKTALELMGRTLAAELQPRGITVINVDPGDMRTRMHQEAFPGEDISDRPLPEVTVPFWEWLVEQLADGDRSSAASISGARFQAQTEDERWAVRV
jgi:NAD(P)-dependent dehydrogenase (short-subunit alcohol dehydrogenase family)